jgi:pimeloyl-ACP methyl ester carboxylesterase
MIRLREDSFAEPDPSRKHEYDGHPIVIHARSERNATELVLLVHGLTGHRYGYWGKLPQFLLEDLPRADVGLYFYRTAWRRIGLMRSIDLEEEARVLACALRELWFYRSITIVAHSMGGILSKATVAELLNIQDSRTLQRVRGLILMACPQLGSLRVPRILRFLSRDGRALLPHNRTIQRIDQVFSSRLAVDQTADPQDRHCLPTFAIIAAEDFWVDALSAGIGIPERQKHTVRAEHSTIVRPEDKNVDSYAFLRNCLDTSIGPELSRELEEIQVDDASPEDAWNIHDYALRMFGEGVTPEDIVMQFIAHGGIFKVVKRIIVTEDGRREQFSGYFCVIPLSGNATRSARTGALRGNQFTMEHVAVSDERTAALYVGAVAGRDRYSRALILGSLRFHLEQQFVRGIKSVLARPLTRDGLRIAEKNLFKPLDHPGLDQLYELVVPHRTQQLNLWSR